MPKTPSWIRKQMKTYIPYDWHAFFTEANVSLKVVAAELGYTLHGLKATIIKGQIKFNKLPLLSRFVNHPEKYRLDGKEQ